MDNSRNGSAVAALRGKLRRGAKALQRCGLVLILLVAGMISATAGLTGMRGEGYRLLRTGRTDLSSSDYRDLRFSVSFNLCHTHGPVKGERDVGNDSYGCAVPRCNAFRRPVSGPETNRTWPSASMLT